MQEIQKRKRQLESELKQTIDRFHKENEIYKVAYISVKSSQTIGRKEEITNTAVKVEINLEVI